MAVTAANGQAQQAFAPVLQALSTMQANIDRSQKAKAHEYLEAFQKSPDAWTATIGMLQSPDSSADAKLFAATTLKGKITYDLHQLPRDSLPSLRDNLFQLLSGPTSSNKPTRTQLCVCMANLAIQMTEWKDVLQLVVSRMGSSPQGIACVLEFLHVLPEEVTEGRKINLSEDELNQRTGELLQDNAEQVLELLMQYSQSSASAAKDPQLLNCLTSWLREVPMNAIIGTPLLDTIIDGLSVDTSFDAAVECLSAIFKETRDVDECLDSIQTLYPRLATIRPRIEKAAAEEDTDMLKGVTRIFAEAGEAWVVLIVRMPVQFRELVESVLECAARDQDREAISLTFNFWFELKQLLVLDKFIEARAQFADLYSKLVDVMTTHLEFPKPDGGNEKDLFDGDREQEEKFREFRHQMGDVLKDCCEVIGVAECLKKPYQLIEKWVASHGAQAQQGQVPDWQALEAPLFSMRAMGRMVTPDENIMLPRLIPLITQIPDHEKVRFQAVMVLGRYTEWTSKHPDTLQDQLNFIMKAFDHPSKEVIRAAALSFHFFCSDCGPLLTGFVVQLQTFYESVLGRLPASSQEEITEGVAAVLARQPNEKIYELFKLYCDPVIERLKAMAQQATDEPQKLALADHIQLVTIFIQQVTPHTEPGSPNPAVQYCQEIFPVLAKIAEVFITFSPILERICRCWRYMVLSYRSSLLPLLPELASKLASGFAESRQGCYLWATGSIVREYSEGAENIDPSTTGAIFSFSEQQATTFLRTLSELTPEELPDMVEDFFRLETDILLYYSRQALSSNLMKPVLSAATAALTLLKEEPLIATLHFLRDFLGYGGQDAPSINLNHDTWNATNPPEIRTLVKQLLISEGETIAQRVMTGMMYSFPRDCFPDASGVLLAMFQVLPQEIAGWIRNMLGLLPAGSITEQESERLMGRIDSALGAGEIRKVRGLLQDFTNSYRRRNVAPREGLGALEGGRFRFSG